MRNKNLLAQCIYRGIWAVVAIVATIFTFTDHISAMGGDGYPVTLYFTTWSVWLCLVVALPVFITTLIRVIKGEKEGYNECLPLLKFCANIMIIATFIVAGFVLKDKLWTAGYWTPGSIFKHFLLPILTVMDCVLFDNRNRFRVTYPLFGVAIPLAYWIIVIIRMVAHASSCGGTIPEAEWNFYYPYTFTNLSNGHSLGGLCGMLAGILVGLIIIGYVFYFVDKLHKENGKVVIDMKVNEEETKDIFHKIKNK